VIYYADVDFVIQSYRLIRVFLGQFRSFVLRNFRDPICVFFYVSHCFTLSQSFRQRLFTTLEGGAQEYCCRRSPGALLVATGLLGLNVYFYAFSGTFSYDKTRFESVPGMVNNSLSRALNHPPLPRISVLGGVMCGPPQSAPALTLRGYQGQNR